MPRNLLHQLNFTRDRRSNGWKPFGYEDGELNRGEINRVHFDFEREIIPLPPRAKKTPFRSIAHSLVRELRYHCAVINRLVQV